MIDHATCTSKFWAVVNWAKLERRNPIGTYLFPHEGNLLSVQVFYPEYYRSLCVRLYNFNGKAVNDEKPMVISYREEVSSDGTPFKLITGMPEEFSTYQEALDYIESQESGNYEIIGTNPFISPIPLEAVDNYKAVYSSESSIPLKDIGTIPEVKIFEYTGGR